MTPSFVPPLTPQERSSLYPRLAEMGARVMAEGKDRLFRKLSDEVVLAVAAEESRFDYRLLYVLVALVAECCERFHPYRLREEMRKMRTPAIWGVIGEFARKVREDRDLEAFFEIVLRDLSPAPHQMFWVNAGKPRPEKMLEVVERTPDEFMKWGFYSDEAPILKELKPEQRAKHFSAARRREILGSLLKARGKIGVADYLVALDHSVSRQQAHKDLSTFPGIKAISDRRGRRYENR